MKTNRLLMLLFISLICNILKAQIPLNDPAWVIKKQDNFDSLKTTYWCNDYCWGSTNNGLEVNYQSNLIFSGGKLKIKADTLIPAVYVPNSTYGTYYYQSGAIGSKFLTKYGYFEIKAILPVGTGARGYWPAFWLYGSGANSCTVWPNNGYWNEIDIAENSGMESQSTTTLGIHYHWRDNTTCAHGVDWWNPVLTNMPDLSVEHKYAVLWEPNRMTWLFDDQPIRVVYDPVYTPDHAIGTIINFALDPTFGQDPDGSTVFPAYFELDHFKLWQLTPECSSNQVICTPTDYNRAVKKTITTNNSCTPTFNTSDNYHLRATDYVLLDVGTTINDNGSGSFSVIIDTCPN